MNKYLELLTPTNLLAIRIPVDVYDIRYKKMPDDTYQLVGSVKDETGNIGTCYINDINFICDIVGLVIYDNDNELMFNFNPEKYVESHTYNNGTTFYRDYCFLADTDQYEHEHLYDVDAKWSFTSLLRLKGMLPNQKYNVLIFKIK